MKSIQFDYQFIPKGSTVEVEYHNNQEMFVIKTKDEYLISIAPFVQEIMEPENTDKKLKKVLFPSSSSIFLDVENDLREGIIDHHHLTGSLKMKEANLQSTTAILTKCPSYMRNVKEYVECVTAFAHGEPDFNAFTSAYLVTYYL